ncbi:hypothetical protein AB4Z52_16480 [Rhizobium sp. 2YAF20]|uniref:hypothetical protein n=1 Tax=Rhizobium sp. 2YAF20 TaxID=3233027 RepID=UPI003F985B75
MRYFVVEPVDVVSVAGAMPGAPKKMTQNESGISAIAMIRKGKIRGWAAVGKHRSTVAE